MASSAAAAAGDEGRRREGEVRRRRGTQGQQGTQAAVSQSQGESGATSDAATADPFSRKPLAAHHEPQTANKFVSLPCIPVLGLGRFIGSLSPSDSLSLFRFHAKADSL